MTDTPPADLIRALVDGPSLVTDVQCHDTVSSTNRLVMEAAAAGAAEGLVVVADTQTAGRGRRGRTWVAPAGSSLMLSILLRPAAHGPSHGPGLPRTAWPLLPLMTGTAVIQACRLLLPGLGGRAALKWPNDLLLDGVKAAGILVESAADAVVVGIGINTDWRDLPRPADLSATSLAEAVGAGVDRWSLLDHLLRRVDADYRMAQQDPSGVVVRYVPDCATLGVDVMAHTATPVGGRAIGLTHEGHLRVRDVHGRDHVVTAGDVEHLR